METILCPILRLNFHPEDLIKCLKSVTSFTDKSRGAHSTNVSKTVEGWFSNKKMEDVQIQALYLCFLDASLTVGYSRVTFAFSALTWSKFWPTHSLRDCDHDRNIKLCVICIEMVRDFTMLLSLGQEENIGWKHLGNRALWNLIQDLIH